MHLNTQLNTMIPKIFFCSPRNSKPRQIMVIRSIRNSSQVPMGHPKKSVRLILTPIIKTTANILKTNSTNVRILDRVKIRIWQLLNNFIIVSWSKMMMLTRRATVKDWMGEMQMFYGQFPVLFENNARWAVFFWRGRT